MKETSDSAPVERRVIHLMCWWFGCDAHPQEYCHRNDNMFQCVRCGEEASYSDLVGDTRHNRFKECLLYWLWRRWFPSKCSDCGKRFGDHSDCIPF
jgi:hypothetical protein